MDFIGYDLGKVSSQVCIITDDGELIERRIRTDREHIHELLGSRPRARVLIESSTESEWVARYLEGLGHEVIVADPNFASMYATRSRKVKTDKRDARTLAEACRLGAYRPAHRISDRQRFIRAQLAVRDTMVRTRARYTILISTLLSREGLRVATGHPSAFLKRLARVALPKELCEEGEPLVVLLRGLNEQIKLANKRLAELVERDDLVSRLCTVPGVGPVTATSFVATLDEHTRFAGAKETRAYLGLVPAEYSSGERRQLGHISKAALAACGGCWSSRPGASCGAATTATRRCMTGQQASPPAAGRGSRRWRWRASWPASSTPCGVTAHASRAVPPERSNWPRPDLSLRSTTTPDRQVPEHGAASTGFNLAASDAANQMVPPPLRTQPCAGRRVAHSRARTEG
jgi:transposase